MIHDISMVLGLQDLKVPVYIGHNAQAVDVSINRLWDDRKPMRMERQSLGASE